jgi:antitoxin component of RelBE/YafQ-DinJ toxin-antitoxin module
MEKTAVITVEIDEELKQQVEAVLAEQDRTIEQEVEWLIRYIVTYKRLPFDIE